MEEHQAQHSCKAITNTLLHLSYCYQTLMREAVGSAVLELFMATSPARRSIFAPAAPPAVMLLDRSRTAGTASATRSAGSPSFDSICQRFLPCLPPSGEKAARITFSAMRRTLTLGSQVVQAPEPKNREGVDDLRSYTSAYHRSMTASLTYEAQGDVLRSTDCAAHHRRQAGRRWPDHILELRGIYDGVHVGGMGAQMKPIHSCPGRRKRSAINNAQVGRLAVEQALSDCNLHSVVVPCIVFGEGLALQPAYERCERYCMQR